MYSQIIYPQYAEILQIEKKNVNLPPVEKWAKSMNREFIEEN